MVLDDELTYFGKQSLRIKASPERRLRATALWPDVLRTEGFNQGFISFWFYDRFLVTGVGATICLGRSVIGNSKTGRKLVLKDAEDGIPPVVLI